MGRLPRRAQACTPRALTFVAISLISFAKPAHAQARAAIAKANETYVLIEGPKTATLEAQVGSEFRKVCAAPCDRPMPIGRTYRIAGDDVHASSPFVLQGTTGSTTVLQVNDRKHHTGSVVTQGGVLVTLVGGLVLVGGLFGSCSEDSSACSDYRWLTVTGGALAVAGVVTIVTGIVLMAQGSESSVEQHDLGASAAPSSKTQSQAFFTDFVTSKPALPAASTTPVISFSF